MSEPAPNLGVYERLQRLRRSAVALHQVDAVVEIEANRFSIIGLLEDTEVQFCSIGYESGLESIALDALENQFRDNAARALKILDE